MTSEYAEFKAKRVPVDFARYIQAKAAGKNDIMRTIGFAQVHGWRNVAEALRAESQSAEPLTALIEKAAIAEGGTLDPIWAGPLAPLIPMASEYVAYFRPLTIRGRLDTRPTAFNIKFVGATQGSGAGFVGPGAPVPVSAMSFQTLTLPFAKVVGIVIFTEELMRFAAPSASATISADLAAAITLAEDEAFVGPDNAGVIGIQPPSITFGQPQYASSGTTAANIRSDAKKLLDAADTARIPIAACRWILTQDLWAHLVTLTTTTGAPCFPALDDGTFIGGLPAIVSGAAISTGSPSEALLILAHGPSIATADDAVATADVSREASVQMDSAPGAGAQQARSLWMNNFVGVRCSHYVNWTVRRPGAIQVVRGINL